MMETIKSHTDLGQSRKLAEFLSLESADMVYVHTVDLEGDEHYDIDFRNNQPLFEDDILAWSLAALLNIIPNSIYDNTDEYSQLEFSKTSVAYHDMNDGIKVGQIKDNLVDACYEMILKLHERKIL